MICVNSHNVIQMYELTYVNSYDEKYIRIHINKFECRNSYRKKQHNNVYIQIHIKLTKGQPYQIEQQPEMIDEWISSQQ